MRLPFTVIVLTYTIAMIGLLIIPGVDNDGNAYQMKIFDAFYFISYTATTIGFGETPYPFTYAQKIWVSVSIYITVLGWFYGIGTLVSLLQDKLFLNEIARAKFRRSVSHIKEDFVIVLGYSDTTSEIIKKMNNNNLRVVVIEKEQQRADYLNLEGFVPHVPILVADVNNSTSLEYAGILSIHCKGIISLFESSALNMRVTLASRILNQHIKIAVRSNSENETANLLDAGANIVENPLQIICYQIQMALKTPSLFKVENWLYDIDNLDGKTFSIPNKDIVICGFGRLGKSLYNMFLENGIKPVVIEINKDKVTDAISKGIDGIICANAEDKYILEQIELKDKKLVIVATNDDTTNLSIVSTIKTIKKDMLIVARENELSDFSIFSNAKIDHIFLPSKILINKTTNAIVNPLSDKMIRLLTHKDEKWGQNLLAKMIKNIHNNPVIFELHINKQNALEVYKHLKSNKSFKLFELRRSRRDRHQYNNLIPLLITREDEDFILPPWDFELKQNDQILFASDENAKDDIEHIINNIYEFHYIIEGVEKNIITNLFKKKEKNDFTNRTMCNRK